MKVNLEGKLVKIEERHIMTGRRCSRVYCPVNLAIQELAPKSNVLVEFTRIIVDGIKYETPKKAVGFMEWFDLVPSKRSERMKIRFRSLSFVLRKARVQ
jgi:hypothetical protein